MANWGTQVVQAVWFLQQQPPDISIFFETLTGGKPDQLQQISLGTSIATGSNGILNFQVQIQPGRVDFLENLAPTAQDGFPLSVDFNLSLRDFSARAERAFDLISSSVRLSFVVNMLSRSTNIVEAIKEISQATEISLPFEDGQELLLQINRRKALKSRSDVPLNRICRWSTASFQQVKMMPPEQPVVELVDFAAFVADVNTIPSSIVFSSEDQLPIWREISEEVIRLCNARSVTALT